VEDPEPPTHGRTVSNPPKGQCPRAMLFPPLSGTRTLGAL